MAPTRTGQTNISKLNEMKFVGSDSRVVTVSFPFRMSVSFAFRSRFVPTSSPFCSYFVSAYPPHPSAKLSPVYQPVGLNRNECWEHSQITLGTGNLHSGNWDLRTGSLIRTRGTGNLRSTI